MIVANPRLAYSGLSPNRDERLPPDRLLPALSESAERVIDERPPDRAPARLLMSRYIAGEVILVVVVFGCTALLGQLPPPRRGDAFHDASHTDVE